MYIVVRMLLTMLEIVVAVEGAAILVVCATRRLLLGSVLIVDSIEVIAEL